MKKFVYVLLFCLISSKLFAQVGVHPQVVFLDAKNRTGQITILNTNEDPKEIIISLEFGYPGYDSLGNHAMILGDTVPQAKISAAPYVKVFPKRLLLQPKEDQVVKFMLRNTSKLKDGIYTCRINILSKNPPEEIDTTYTDEISAKLDIQFTLRAALILRKGKLNCNLDITNTEYKVDSNNVDIIFDFKRSGNSPFLGTAELSISDLDGNEIASLKEPTPIYFDSRKSFKFRKSQFVNKKYRVNLLMSNEHKDIPENFKIPMKSKEKSFVIDLKGI